MGRGKGKGRRPATKKYSYVNLSWPGLPVVYLPCPHQHLKSPTVDRKTIDREQHMNLLATPKGYKWEQPECNKKQTTKLCKKKPICTESISPQDCPNINNTNNNKACRSSMDDVWKCASPELLDKLVNLFVDDFHLSRNEAKSFVCEQNDANKMMQRMAVCPCPCASGDMANQNIWMREFSELIACKLRNQIALVLCGRRNRRQKMLMELAINFMSDVTGECINISCPETRMHKILVFLADRATVWMDRMFEESEKKLAEDDAAKDKAKIDEEERKRKEAEEEERRRKEQEDADREAAEREAAEREAAADQAEKERLEKEKAEEEAKAAAAAEEGKPPEEEVKPEPEEEKEKPPPPEEEKPPAEEPPPPPEEAAEPASAEEKAGEEPPAEETAPLEEGAGEGVEEPAEEVPAEEEAPAEEPPAEEAPVEEAAVEEEPPQEEPVEEAVQEEVPIEGEAPPEAIDPMSVIVDWIRETEYDKTARQEQIGKVVKGRLESSLQDHLGTEGMGAAIDLLGNQVSTWIDKLAKDAEKEITPLVKVKSKFAAPKGVLYHIKRGSDNYYRVRQVSCADVEARKGKMDKPMTSDDIKDFTKWAENLIKVSDDWTRWVENAFCEAYTMYNRSANQPDDISSAEFKCWRDSKRKEAVEWKRTQKAIFKRAKRWEQWAQFTKGQMQNTAAQ